MGKRTTQSVCSQRTCGQDRSSVWSANRRQEEMGCEMGHDSLIWSRFPGRTLGPITTQRWSSPVPDPAGCDVAKLTHKKSVQLRNCYVENVHPAGRICDLLFDKRRTPSSDRSSDWGAEKYSYPEGMMRFWTWNDCGSYHWPTGQGSHVGTCCAGWTGEYGTSRVWRRSLHTMSPNMPRKRSSAWCLKHSRCTAGDREAVALCPSPIRPIIFFAPPLASPQRYFVDVGIDYRAIH